ncbi:MAG TPA: HAD-IB family hydrolase [Mycobacteriales bacterium]|nr:HAD-IB family hydrolase [Mycobacteriales bacterium]
MGGAAFFDLDKTVIAKSSTLAFGRTFYQGGLVNRRAVLRSSYAQFVYLIAGADADQMARMRDYLKGLCAGWPVDQVRSIVEEALHDLIDPLVYDEAVSLIEGHQAAGRAVVIVSSSGEEVVTPIAEMVGADHAIATRMVIEDGRYTGDIAFYAYGVHKAEAIEALAAEQGWFLADCWAYSDSITDLPMLDAVGHPVVVNPDKALRRVAVQRGWEVRDFTRPVGLRSRVPTFTRPPVPVLAGAAVGVGAVALGWRMLAARRRATRC